MGMIADAALPKTESTGWDSNPCRRITGAVSSPLDHQCLLVDHTAPGDVDQDAVGPQRVEDGRIDDPARLWAAGGSDDVSFIIDAGVAVFEDQDVEHVDGFHG